MNSRDSFQLFEITLWILALRFYQIFSINYIGWNPFDEWILYCDYGILLVEIFCLISGVENLIVKWHKKCALFSGNTFRWNIDLKQADYRLSLSQFTSYDNPDDQQEEATGGEQQLNQQLMASGKDSCIATISWK